MRSSGCVNPVAEPKAVHRSSVFELEARDLEVFTTSGPSDVDLDLMLYSGLKYGDPEASEYFGRLMANHMVAQLGAEFVRSSWISASPYKSVPTTACALLDAAITELARMGCPPLGVVKLDRRVLAYKDFATMTDAERALSTETRAVSVPTATIQQLLIRDEKTEMLVQCNHLIVLDDARIGGFTERATIKALTEVGIRDVTYIYLTMLAKNGGDSSIENALNSCRVKTLQDLAVLFNMPGHYLNARTCKRVLRGTPEEITCFVKSISPEALSGLIADIIADGYHTMPESWPACTALGIDVSYLINDSKEN